MRRFPVNGGLMRPDRQRLLRIAACIAGTAFLIIGIVRGEPAAVFQKAVKICLECIGIG